MILFTKPQLEQLLKNGSPENRDKDHKPVVKLILPGSGATWLLTELDPEEPDRAFGLCDLGLGYPELGYVSIQEITSVKSRFGLSVERDRYFEAKYPISVYANAARACEFITDDNTVLARYCLRKVLTCKPE